MKLIVFRTLLFLALVSQTLADITRAEALQIAERFVKHRWTAEAKHVRHGKDSSGIEIHTPDRKNQHGSPDEDCWTIGENTGVAYKPKSVNANPCAWFLAIFSG